MTDRLMAAAPVNSAIAFKPSIDFRSGLGVFVDGTPDAEVLPVALEGGRVLPSRDIKSRPRH